MVSDVLIALKKTHCTIVEFVALEEYLPQKSLTILAFTNLLKPEVHINNSNIFGSLKNWNKFSKRCNKHPGLLSSGFKNSNVFLKIVDFLLDLSMVQGLEGVKKTYVAQDDHPISGKTEYFIQTEGSILEP
jgi:hypothetical protein